MTKEFWEHTSILLEVAAFICITKDLFGNARLAKWTRKLQEINELNLWLLYSRIFNSLKPIFAVFISISFAGLVIEFVLVRVYGRYDIADNIIDYYLIFGWVWLSYNTLVVTSPLYLFPIIKLLKFTIKIFPVDGVLLFLGTLLFMVSKSIAFYVVNLPCK